MNKHISIIAFLLFLSSGTVSAQVSITLHQPPPFRFNISSLWNVTLVNASGENLNVYLHGQASKSGEGLVVEANTSAFILQPGVKMVNASEIQPIDVKEANQTYKDIIRSTGSIPAGEYEICVTVIDADNGVIIGTDCITHSVQNFSQVEIISPMNGSEIFELYPVFTWIPPTPVSSGAMLNYTLNIYEILGRQTPYNAVQSNREFFQFPGIRTTVFRYPAASRSFMPGKRYAVQVIAYIGEVLISESEINDFVYLDNVLAMNEYNIPLTPKISGGENDMLKSSIMRNRQFQYDSFLKTPSFTRRGQGEVNKIPFIPLYNKEGQEDVKESPLTPLYQGGNSFFLPSFLKEGSVHDSYESMTRRGEDSPFKFSGSTGIEFEGSDQPGRYSNLENVYGRFEVIPKVSFYDIPFGFNFFLATDQSEEKQNMNSFIFDFNPANVKDVIQQKVEDKVNSMREDLERRIQEKGERFRASLESQAKDRAMSEISFPLKLFSMFQSLGIGMNYPQYTDYTVSGVSVTGANIEFNPGLFYIALTGARNNSPIENKTFRRNLYAGRLGVGQKDDSHLFFTMMMAKDDINSITVDPSNTSLTPKSNYVVGTEGALNLLSNKLKLHGEIGISFLTDDLNAAEMISDDIPQWIKNLVDPRISSRVDGFYKVGTSFDNDKTNTSVKAEVMMIGPGYLSLGSPTKKNDKLEFQITAAQKFLDNQMTAKVTFKRGRDNLLKGFKNFTTSNSLLNLNLSMRFRNYPSLTINYFPVFLSNDAVLDNDVLDNVNHNLMVITTYPFKFSEITNNVSLMFAWNAANTYKALNDSWNWNLNVTDVISFTSPLFISSSFGLQRFGGLQEFSTYIFDLNTGYTFFESWQNAIGFNLTTSPDENKNLTFYLNSSTRIEEKLNLDLRFEKNIYDDLRFSNLNRNDYVLRLTGIVDW
jgi:hypothetical protein